MKDKHNVILTLISSSNFNSLFRSGSSYHILGSRCFIFSSRVQSFPFYLIAEFHPIIARFHLVFLTSFSFRLHHPFVTGVLHGCSTWWFIKDLIRSRSVHQDSFQRSSSILHLAIQSAILSIISLEVVLCHSG